LRAAGYGGYLAGPSGLDSPEFVAAAGAAATGTLITGFPQDADVRARVEAFGRRFRQTYNTEPDFTAAAAHDAALVLIATLRPAGQEPGSRLFPPTAPIAGVTGSIHFDLSGNRTDLLQVWICQHGQFLPLPLPET
jgi:ABC-type branched-subunit amino acid transport system substrate-binding protein